jgi:hypothetical protein
MKVSIEFGIACTRCVALDLEWAGRTLHSTTIENCERALGRPCEHPDEHHRPRRRAFVRVHGQRRAR